MYRIFATLTLLTAFSSTATAGLIFELDFDSTTPEFSQTTGNSDTGTAPGFSIVAGAGVGGSNGVVIDFDTTGAFSTGFFTQLRDQLPGNNDILTTPTSTNQSDYFYSFDVRATGFLPGVTSAGGQSFFQFNGNMSPNQPLSTGVTEEFQTFSIFLDPGTINPNTFFTSGSRPTWQVELLGVINNFGEDNNNSLVLDNFRLNQVKTVPEPSSLFLLAAGIAGFVRRRRSV